MLINKFALSLILIISFNSSSFFIKTFITLPFSYINKNTGESIPNTTTPNSYFKSFLKNPIYTTIKVNNKNLKFHLTIERYATYISANSLKEIDPQSFQSSNNDDENLYSLEYIGIPRTVFTKNSFSFLLNNTINIIISNYSFFMAKKMSEESEYIKRINFLADEKEEIGLNIFKGNKNKEVQVEEDDSYEDFIPDNIDIDEDDYEYGSIHYQNKNKSLNGEKYISENNGYTIEEKSNLINQLKEQKYISSYAFMINYDNKNEEKGKIVIGGLPHEYDPRHYSEKNFIYDKAVFNNRNPAWRISFQNIFYGSYELKAITSVEFSLNFGFILSYSYYKQYLDEQFFSKFSDYCKEEKIDIYTVKYCKEKAIKEFKNLVFILSNTHNDLNKSNKIEFDYKDLFIKDSKNNDLYYFQIVFEDYNFKWVFGRPLFKKYPVIFDQDKKIIGFYTETGEYDVDISINKSNNSSMKLSLSWILVIILSICIIILGIIFYLKFPYIKRKKKANELNDNFDYEPASDNNKENEKNKLFKN